MSYKLYRINYEFNEKENKFKTIKKPFQKFEDCEDIIQILKNFDKFIEGSPIVVVKIIGTNLSNEVINHYSKFSEKREGKLVRIYKVTSSEIEDGKLVRIERLKDRRSLIILSHPSDELFLLQMEKYVQVCIEKSFKYYYHFSEEKLNQIKSEFNKVINNVHEAESFEEIKPELDKVYENLKKKILITEITEGKKIIEYFSQIYEQNATPKNFFRSFWYDIREDYLKSLESYANLASESISSSADLQSQTIAKDHQERLERIVILMDFIIVLEAILIMRQDFPISEIKEYFSMYIHNDYYASVLTYLAIIVGILLLFLLILVLSTVQIMELRKKAMELRKKAKKKIITMFGKFYPKA